MHVWVVTCTCMYGWLHVHVRMYVWVFICTCMYVWLHVYVLVCLGSCIYKLHVQGACVIDIGSHSTLTKTQLLVGISILPEMEMLGCGRAYTYTCVHIHTE